jgi:hypothetical protein
MTKVGHSILKKGDVIKSPSGEKEWVVVEPASTDDENIKIQALGKVMNKDDKSLMSWDRKE